MKKSLFLFKTVYKKIIKIFYSKYFLTLLLFLIQALIFTLYYMPKPYYRANQHTKFLHGLAQAGFGYLRNDWLANTRDPLPIFTFLIFITQKFFHQYFFYIYFIILMGFFIYSIQNISINMFKNNNLEQKDKFLIKLIIFTVILGFFSVFFRLICGKFLFGIYITNWFFIKGVADQYIFGTIFQPSMFGILILFSISLFIKNKVYAAVTVLIILASIHTVYIFSAGVLILSYMIILLIEDKNIKKVFLTGFFALILILPTLFYNYFYLGPSSENLTKESLNILTNIRIPEHSIPEQWIDISTIFKILMIIVSLIILRKTKLFIIILTSFLLSFVLTVIQMFIKNDFIALVAPWRISAFLVPLSTGSIIGYLIVKLFQIFKNQIDNHYKIIFIFFIIVLICLTGFEIYKKRINIKEYLTMHYIIDKKTEKMINFIEKNKLSSDIYFTPASFIDFRLNTGACVFVNWKSHPYKDYEVIEWYNRIKICQKFYSNDTGFLEKYNILKKLNSDYNITHIILTKNEFKYKFEFFEEVYKDLNFGVYKIK